MAKLKAYNSMYLPGVTPKVNYYDGKDFYNIAGIASSLRKPADDLAYNKAMALTERYIAEEETAKTTGPDLYNGDPVKLKEAELAELQAGAARGDSAAIAGLQAYSATGSTSTTPDRHYSTYEDRMNTREAEIIEETGLTGKQLEQYKINVYRMNTAMMEKNNVDRDAQMDIEVVNEQKGIFAEFIDAGETEQAVGVAQSLRATGRISQAIETQMIDMAYVQQDGDRITAEADAYYAQNSNLDDLSNHMRALIDNDELWDGKGMGTKADRQAYMAEYGKILEAKNQGRIRDAANEMEENYLAAATMKNDFMNGDVSPEALNEYRMSLEDLQESQASRQAVDKVDPRTLQATIDWLRIKDEDETISAADQKKLNAAFVLAFDEQVADWRLKDMTDNQIVQKLQNTPVNINGKDQYPGIDFLIEEYYEKKAPLVTEAKQAGIKMMNRFKESGMTDAAAANMYKDYMQYVEDNLENAGPSIITEAEQYVVGEYAQNIFNGNQEPIEERWLRKGKSNDEFNEQQAGFEGIIGPTSYNTILNGAASMEYLIEQSLNVEGGEFQDLDKQTDLFRSMDGYNDFLNADTYYKGFSSDARSSGGRILVPSPAAPERINLGLGAYANIREVSMAERDRTAAQGEVAIDSSLDTGEKLYLLESFDKDGNPAGTGFYKITRTLSGDVKSKTEVKVNIPSTDLGDMIIRDGYVYGIGQMPPEVAANVHKDVMMFDGNPNGITYIMDKYSLDAKPDTDLYRALHGEEKEEAASIGRVRIGPTASDNALQMGPRGGTR